MKTKTNTKWFQTSESYPKDGQKVEIQDDVGKIGRAIFCVDNIKGLNGNKIDGWMIETDFHFRDFTNIIKWRPL